MKAQHTTTTFKGFEFDVIYNCKPAEPEVNAGEEFGVLSIYLYGEDASELLQAYYDDFENTFIKQLKDEY